MTTFTDFYRENAENVAARAMGQRVPGLDHDDVVSEMAACMWRAWKTHDPSKGSFGPYWWSMWLNRRNNLTRDAFRIKVPRVVLIGDPMDWGYYAPMPIHPPTDTTDEEAVVWLLLAAGEPARDVMEAVGWSKNRYYRLLHRWRTSEVKALLRG